MPQDSSVRLQSCTKTTFSVSYTYFRALFNKWTPTPCYTSLGLRHTLCFSYVMLAKLRRNCPGYKYGVGFELCRRWFGLLSCCGSAIISHFEMAYTKHNKHQTTRIMIWSPDSKLSCWFFRSILQQVSVAHTMHWFHELRPYLGVTRQTHGDNHSVAVLRSPLDSTDPPGSNRAVPRL